MSPSNEPLPEAVWAEVFPPQPDGSIIIDDSLVEASYEEARVLVAKIRKERASTKSSSRTTAKSKKSPRREHVLDWDLSVRLNDMEKTRARIREIEKRSRAIRMSSNKTESFRRYTSAASGATRSKPPRRLRKALIENPDGSVTIDDRLANATFEEAKALIEQMTKEQAGE